MNALPAARAGLVALLLALTACGEDGSNDDGAGDNGGSDGGGLVTGTGDSLARMTIAGDCLYAIKGPDEVQLFDITTPSDPLPFTDVRIEFGLETLFTPSSRGPCRAWTAATSSPV